jgi:hypothetical protein
MRQLLVLTLLFPASVLAAGLTCSNSTAPDVSPPEQGKLVELEEIVVRPGRSITRTTDLEDWLKRLEGQYRYEGYVDRCGNTNVAHRQPVTGEADCVPLYHPYPPNPTFPGPRLRSLYCVLDVRWPQLRDDDDVPVMGVESGLSPAVAIYSVVPDLPGIQFMQIDDMGMVTHAKGKLVGDTLTTRESCGMSGSCQRVTRISAAKDSKEIAMLVDFEIDSRPVLRNAFLLHRVSNVPLSRPENYDQTRAELESVGHR